MNSGLVYMRKSVSRISNAFATGGGGTNFEHRIQAAFHLTLLIDRYAITMQTVGSGLSYASLDDNGLPSYIVMEELNKPENEEMRRGYYIGIINQRGVHWVDSEGKEELELAKAMKKTLKVQNL